MYILDVEVWLSLIVYIGLMTDYVDVSTGVNGVTCSRLSCPYVLLECDCTCDKMMMCVSSFGRPISFYLMQRKWIWTLDLVGLRTYVMYVSVWLKYDLEHG